MVMIANLQYGWTLFVGPIGQKHGWDRASIQVAFTIFVLTETWLVPIEGWFVDRYGPKIVVVIGGVLVGISWMLNAYVSTLAMLYISAAIGGIGAGAVYGTCVGNALKWFPDKRGLAAGLTAAGFGAGSALTIIPIQAMIRSSGYEATFFWFGLGQGLVVFVLGWFLIAPRPGQVPASAHVQQSARNYTPVEMLRTPIFWVMYLMFVLVGAGGLMATAQLAPIANDFKVAGVPVTLIGITLPALTFALSIDRVLNGITRPFFGWVSDHIGRENTMFIAFSPGGGRHLGAELVRPRPGDVRAAERAGVLRLGRDLQPVPLDLHRRLRQQVRHHQCRPALHGERHGLAAGAAVQRADGGDRRLACRVRRRGDHERHRGGHGAGRAASAAGGGTTEQESAGRGGIVPLPYRPARRNSTATPRGVAACRGG